jgi:zinc/manganese transport system substrate-binding protein
MADMVREIGGSLVTPRPIVGPDRDSHGFSPKPSDARIVQSARVAVANGLGFDPWMDRMVRSTGFRGPFVLAATGVAPRTMPDTHGHGHAQRAAPAPRRVTDPHAWQDLGNVPVYARNISDGLKRALPQEAATIDANAADFSRRAAETDAWVRAEIATVPAERRRVLTSHDAFGYFAAAYGVTFLSPQGVSTESEPSAAAVARLIRQIREQDIRAVFLENMSNPRSLEQIARDAGVRVVGSLHADALSAPGGPAATYLGMFRHNVPLMVRAMQQ